MPALPTTNFASHLEEDAFVDLALGMEPGRAVRDHLAGCRRCQEELARFGDAVTDFSGEALAWSKFRSDAMPVPRRGDSAGSRVGLFPAASWAVAALLLAGVAVPVARHFGGQPSGARLASFSANNDASGWDSPEQIAKDNELMAEVNFELNRSEATLVQEEARQRPKAGRESAPFGSMKGRRDP